MAKVRVIENVDPQEIAPGYIPDDDDPGMPPAYDDVYHVFKSLYITDFGLDFTKLAKEFCLPTRDDFENNPYVYRHPKDRESMFSITFSEFIKYSESVQTSQADDISHTFNPFLSELIRALLYNVEWPKRRPYVFHSPILLSSFTKKQRSYTLAPFSIRIPQLSSSIKLRNCSIISKRVKENSFSVPLMFPSVRLPSSFLTKCEQPSLILLQIANASYDTETQLARHEVPQCLLQAILAYSKNPNLPQYTAFALCLHRTTIRISKATIPQIYVKEFFQKAEINEFMQLYQSETFNLLDRDGRKGFLRLIMGVFRYMMEMEESDIILPD